MEISYTASHINQPDARLDEYQLSPEALALAQECLAEVQEEYEKRPSVVVFGKPAHQNRNVQFRSMVDQVTGDTVATGYYYSGGAQLAKPMSAKLVQLTQLVNQTCRRADGSEGRFNAALFNEYETGSDYISAHADNEDGLDPEWPDVFGVSIGATRTFRITRNQPGSVVNVIDVPAKHGHALRMVGTEFQNRYKHGVPQQKKVLDTRHSITFRAHDPQRDARLRAAWMEKEAKKADVTESRKRAREHASGCKS